MTNLHELPEGDALDRTRPLRGFSIDDYRRILVELSRLGYEAVDLEELDPDRPLMFLRHDVDLCLGRAVAVAEAEHALRMRATYYVLVSTEMYNPASAESRRRMRRIVELGHSVGLHFDATKYEGGRAELEAAANEECELLSRLAGAPVRSLSFHRPAPELRGLADRFAGRVHTYEPRFFNEIGYISDSSGGWYRGHPLDHPAIAARTAIQLLTHPAWWHSATPRLAEEEIEALRAERAALIGEGLDAATANAKSLTGG